MRFLKFVKSINNFYLKYAKNAFIRADGLIPWCCATYALHRSMLIYFSLNTLFFFTFMIKYDICWRVLDDKIT